MDVIIKETGEHKQLTLSWPGAAGDWADEIIGQSGAVGTYIDRDDDGTYHMDQDSYQWWEQYMLGHSPGYERRELAKMGKINLDQETIDRLLDLYNDKRRKFNLGVELLDSDNDKIAARGSDYMSEGCGALTAIDSLLDILGYQIIVDDEDCAYDIRYIGYDDLDDT